MSDEELVVGLCFVEWRLQSKGEWGVVREQYLAQKAFLEGRLRDLEKELATTKKDLVLLVRGRAKCPSWTLGAWRKSILEQEEQAKKDGKQFEFPEDWDSRSEEENDDVGDEKNEWR